MPLPQKVIEQIGREPPKTPGWSGQLLMFSSTVFFLSLFIYLGLAFGYKPYLNSQVKKLQDQIQSFSEQIPLEDQAKLIAFYSQIANLKSLLDNHVIVSPIFGWLEKNTQANVYYTNFSLDVYGAQLSLSGVARTADDANQQFAIFETAPEVTAFSVTTLARQDANWNFSATLSFAPSYFYGNGAAPPPLPSQ